jgi:CubicO group peptidase (beta-lactamase class C family)
MSIQGSSRRSVLGLLTAAPVAVGALFAVAAPAAADAGSSGPSRGLLPGGEYEKFVAARAAADQFSGNVMVAYRGHPVLIRSYGMADKARNVANTPGTIFDLESVTKTFTAVACARLVERGKVNLYDKLGAYLDGFPPEVANVVTVHQLLTHTSGLGVHGNDFSDTQEFRGERLTWTSGQQTMDGILAIIRKQPLLFTPGTRNGYSNSGMFLVGAIVEQVSGQSYYDYVREHVFTAAGMVDTDFYTRPQVRSNPRIAHAYLTDQSGAHTDFTDSDNFGYIGTPVQGAYSTVSDLLRYAHALRTGRLLSPSFASLFTAAKVALSPTDAPPDPSTSRFYGYGFRVKILNDHDVFGHSGSGAGTATNLDIYPDLDWVGVVLSNYSDPITSIVDMEQQLVADGRAGSTH